MLTALPTVTVTRFGFAMCDEFSLLDLSARLSTPKKGCFGMMLSKAIRIKMVWLRHWRPTRLWRIKGQVPQLCRAPVSTTTVPVKNLLCKSRALLPSV